MSNPTRTVVKARRRVAPKPPEPTDPGDTIEVSITAEVKNKQGRSFWAKVGVVSSHRNEETTEEAYSRITDFVIERVGELTAEYLE